MQKKIYFWLLLIFLLTAGLHQMGIFKSLENRAVDHRLYVQYLLTDMERVENNIIIVGIDGKSLHALGRWPWERAVHSRLLRELKNAGAKTIGLDIIFEEQSKSGTEKLAQIVEQNSVVIPVTLDLEVYGGLFGGQVKVLNVNLPSLLFHHAPLGHINLLPDEDGVVRRGYPQIDNYESFSLTVAKLYKPTGHFPTAPFLINYRGPAGSFPIYSYIDVLEGRYPADTFAGKIVLVGAVDGALGDQFTTPLAQSGLMTGVEIHAHQIATLISGKTAYSLTNGQVLLLIAVFALICGFITCGQRPISKVSGFIFLGIGYYVLSQYVFVRQGLLIPYTPVVIILFSYLICGMLLSYFQSDAEKSRLYQAFHRYLAPQVLAEVLKKSEEVRLGGAEKLAAVLFIDIRGFTTYTREHSPESVVELLNRYLQLFEEVIFANAGTLDKYLGDGVMAVFGAPVEGKDDLARAYQAALQIRARVEAENLPLPLGMGLAYGPVISGNIGSLRRMDFTVIGDIVNTASRLEGLAGPGEIVMTEEVVRNLQLLEILPREEIAIKGLPGKTPIYRVSSNCA